MLLSSEQIDALKEFINIGVGRSAAMLNEMVQFPIKLHVPNIRILDYNELKKELSNLSEDKVSTVQLNFSGSLTGVAELVFPSISAAKLVALLTGEEIGSIDLDSLRAGTLCEVGNIVLNGVMGSISNLLEKHFNYSVPRYYEDDFRKMISSNMKENTVYLMGEAQFEIEKLKITGEIILLFELGAFEEIKIAIDNLLGKS